MPHTYKSWLFCIAAAVCLHTKAIAQSANNRLVKMLGVANGLPQSVVNGIVQDSAGFVWIGTRDGLARYDGRKCKVFRHIPGDSLSVAGNTIAQLSVGSHNRLWILYETGDVDVLNTLTESVSHITAMPAFRPLFKALKWGLVIAEDSRGNGWLLGREGVFICNLAKNHLAFYPYASLQLAEEKVTGISYDKGIVISTDQSYNRFDENHRLTGKIIYNKPGGKPGNITSGFKNYYTAFRPNGDAVIRFRNEIKVYDPGNHSLITIPLNNPDLDTGFNSLIIDKQGNAYFDYAAVVYQLSADNRLTVWKPKKENPELGFKSMLLDRSGVLWLGSNGQGIQLFDQRLSRLSAYFYERNFPKDIFKTFLHIPAEEIKAAFVPESNPYSFRWARAANGALAFAEADKKVPGKQQVYFCRNNHIITPPWRYAGASADREQPVSALAFSRLGQLWSINSLMQLQHYDTATHVVSTRSLLPDVRALYITALLVDGEDRFWFTTAFDGLYSYNKRTGDVVHYAHSNKNGSLPSNQLISLVQDATDSATLWICSLGSGIIKFNKATGTCTYFTEANGLPNSTVYAMVPDDNGIFWCSSNKGIFSFDPHTGKVLQTFISEDGLPGDEFNRFHFFRFGSGDIAFGGINGYTVFNPLMLKKDDYQPSVGFTAIDINNQPADFGQPHSPFPAAVNSLARITLPYDQNFLTFHFAALEYNIPEKIKYRYRLQGFDDGWIASGNNNTATYTKLPPGHYTFLVNATNTSGIWSGSVKKMEVAITPPFWLTWWFETAVALLVAALVYWFIRYRVGIIRREERQKILFEQEASELKAQALRAQMNPHFIFNSLNSIKALIQEDKKQPAVIYLTTFAKLIRSQLSNAQPAVSLREELETCRLYTQLESLRFGADIQTEFIVDDAIDTHSLMIPPLLLQPFVENAIWHGILPKGKGTVVVSVRRKGDDIVCTIDDDGIGRERAAQNKPPASYESKGMQLVKHRLTLFNTTGAHNASLEIVDKKDSRGQASGTLIIITFKGEL